MIRIFVSWGIKYLNSFFVCNFFFFFFCYGNIVCICISRNIYFSLLTRFITNDKFYQSWHFILQDGLKGKLFESCVCLGKRKKRRKKKKRNEKIHNDIDIIPRSNMYLDIFFFISKEKWVKSLSSKVIILPAS